MDGTIAFAKVKVKHTLIPNFSNVRFNERMDLPAIRRRNLRKFIKTLGHGVGNGKPIDFCNKYPEMSEARLSQLLSETYRDGKSFGEKAARKVEKMIGKPTLWLDRLNADVGSDEVLEKFAQLYMTGDARQKAFMAGVIKGIEETDVNIDDKVPATKSGTNKK